MGKQVRFSAKELAKIRAGVRVMKRDSGIYRVLRDELGRLGYWKKKRRGKGF